MKCLLCYKHHDIWPLTALNTSKILTFGPMFVFIFFLGGRGWHRKVQARIRTISIEAECGSTIVWTMYIQSSKDHAMYFS